MPLALKSPRSGRPVCHWQEAMPAFVAMVTMPFTFSIGYGIIAGLLLWTLGMATALQLSIFLEDPVVYTYHDMESHHLWAVSIWLSFSCLPLRTCLAKDCYSALVGSPSPLEMLSCMGHSASFSWFFMEIYGDCSTVVLLPFPPGKEDPLMRCKALWAGVFVEGIEEGDTPLSDKDTDLPSESSLPHQLPWDPMIPRSHFSSNLWISHFYALLEKVLCTAEISRVCSLHAPSWRLVATAVSGVSGHQQAFPVCV